MTDIPAPEPSNITRLAPATQTDVQLAADLRKRVLEAYEPVCRIFEEARKHNFHMSVSTGMDLLGRCYVTQVNIVREL
jgi:hypothetical protein